MKSVPEDKTSWLASAVNAPVGVIRQTLNFKRLFSISSQAVDARAKLDGMQKAVAAQARQIGETRQGIADTHEALAALESELSGLTKEVGHLTDKP